MGQYFDRQPAAASRPGSVELILPDLRVTLRTDRGVFSPDAVDAGTKLLLLEAPRPATGTGPVTLLDLGCGYGAIAVALAVRAPEATVWAVDVNERARELAAANADDAGVGDRVRVAAPDDVPADVELDGIWSNPPIRVGKTVLHEMLERWLPRLRRPDGRAYLVVHRHLGSDSLHRWLLGEGWEVTRLCSRAGYRVLEVEPS